MGLLTWGHRGSVPHVIGAWKLWNHKYYSENNSWILELENLHMDKATNYMFWAITEAEGEDGIP